MRVQAHHLPEHIDMQRLDGICRHFGVKRLEMFGSAARGNLRDGSDVDLLVQFAQRDDMGPADQYFGLKEALEELFGRPVDLLTEGAVRNPYLKRHIAKQARVLYVKRLTIDYLFANLQA